MTNEERKMKNEDSRLRSPFFIFHFSLFIILLITTACSDKETTLGLNLVDPMTLYNGQTTTFTANTAYSLRDDSLRTSGYSFCIIGNRVDPLFGKVSSDMYTQIGLSAGTSTINFNEVDIDSVVLTMVIDELYPDTGANYNFHFEVMQLAEQVVTDTTYYGFDALPVDPTKVFFNQTVAIGAHDTVVNLKLDPSIKQTLNIAGTSDEFIAATKGLRIRIVDDADLGMLTVNLAALKTCLTAYYHYGTDTTLMQYTFLVGTGVQHFTHFEHDYSGTIFDGLDSVDGSTQLYLEPLAGYNIKLSFDNQLQAFHAAHPLAVVHYAELQMPVVNTTTSALMPDQVIVSRCTDSSEIFIPDQIDPYTYRGYDGTFDDTRNIYRARITEHLQDILREGRDPGILLSLNSRRSSARQVVFAGNGNTVADPIKIVFVYTE